MAHEYIDRFLQLLPEIDSPLFYYDALSQGYDALLSRGYPVNNTPSAGFHIALQYHDAFANACNVALPDLSGDKRRNAVTSYAPVFFPNNKAGVHYPPKQAARDS